MEYVLTIQRAIHSIKGDNSKGIYLFIYFFQNNALFSRLFILYQVTHSWVLAPACGALVSILPHCDVLVSKMFFIADSSILYPVENNKSLVQLQESLESTTYTALHKSSVSNYINPFPDDKIKTGPNWNKFLKRIWNEK